MSVCVCVELMSVCVVTLLLRTTCHLSRCFLPHAFRAGLRAALFGLLLLGPLVRARARACARPHVSLLGWGPAGAQKAHIIAQDTFLMHKT